jgi:uncharacterized protein (DUF1697 family)
MKKYLALLRGINVGGNSKVEMKKLKAAFEEAGFSNVSTYINSGNVIFESKETDQAELIATIKIGLRKHFDFDIKVIIRDRENILKLASSVPDDWRNDKEQKTDVLFLWDEFDNKNSIKLIQKVKGIDNLKYSKGAIIWNIDRKDYGKSGMNKFIGTVLYKNMTARNINTLRKLVELMNRERDNV